MAGCAPAARRQNAYRTRRLASRRCSQPITPSRTRWRSRSRRVGLLTISARKNDGQSTAACETSPHRPQPTQLSITVATGSRRSGSGLGRIDSDGQPESRMQEWSPVQVSGSTPKRSRTTRSPAAAALRARGFSRRCLLSMHSLWAMSTFGPFTGVVSASRSVAVMVFRS